MSLLYIIDGYNVIKHPSFSREAKRGGAADDVSGVSREELFRFIREKRPAGSPRNRVVVVFDGYSGRQTLGDTGGITVIFSCRESADEKIKKIVEGHAEADRKNIVVVSSDREIIGAAKLLGASSLSAQDFAGAPRKRAQRAPDGAADAQDAKISYAQMEKINRELRERWL